MKINKSLRSKIALGLLVGGLSVPMMATESFAAPMARPSVRVSTPRVSTPRASIPRVSTPKVSSPKPSSIKPGTSTMKPSKPITSSSKPSTSKPITNSSKPSTSKPKSSTSTPKSNTNTPKKTVTRTPKAPTNYTRPSYINNYSSTGSGYSRDLNFWRLYGITHMISGNRNPSEREIAEELAKKGYSESEVKKIMKEAEKEQKTKKEKKSIFSIIGGILMGVSALILVGVGIFFLFKRF